MQGHFEVDQNAYPIGYLENNSAASKDAYLLTDMRNLKPLHPDNRTLAECKTIAPRINRALRLGEIQTSEALTSLVEFEIAKLAESSADEVPAVPGI